MGGNPITEVQEYNGTSWSEGTSIQLILEVILLEEILLSFAINKSVHIFGLVDL